MSTRDPCHPCESGSLSAGTRRRSAVSAVLLTLTCFGPGALVASETLAPSVAPPVEAPGKVTLLRDRWGMAHIYARREQDGFFGLGYAIAADRLEQVLLIYLAARGELAARFGPGPVGTDKVSPFLAGVIGDTVASDLKVRQFRILEYARSNLRRLPRQYQLDLAAYIDGINAYLDAHPDQRPPWAPMLEPALPLAAFTQLVDEPAQVCPRRIAQETLAATSRGDPEFKGSNAWAVGPSRVADRGVVFSSDSHGPWSMLGTLFYPWRMKAGSLDFQTFEPTGTAMLFFGHSRNFAWGWTEGPRFAGDCYRIRTLSDDPGAYLFDGKVRHFEKVQYSIEVKGAAPLTGTFEYSRHNGVLSPVVERRGEHAYVVSFATVERVGLGHGELYRMAHARNRHELRAALAAMEIYPANLLIAGNKGDLFYIRPGRIPKRPAHLDLTRPLDGNTAKTAWTGYVSLAQAVQLENPPQGYIANNNVSPDMMYPSPVLEPDDYPPYMAFEPGQTTSRQTRILELLQDQRQLTDETAIRLTLDEKIPGFDRWAQRFATLDAAGLWPRKDAGLARFISRLIAFDGTMSRDSAAALAFAAFYEGLRSLDEPAMYELTMAVTQGGVLSERQQELIRDAVSAAHADLEAKFGSAELTYGDLYRVGRGKADWPTGGGGFVVGGSEQHLDLQGGRAARPLVVAPLRAMRFQPHPGDPRLRRAFCCQRIPFVVAFHPDGSLTSYSQVLPGVSDDPRSPHYDDQLRLASEGQLRRNYFDLADLLGNVKSSQVLNVKGTAHAK